MSTNKAKDAWRLIEAAKNVAKSDEARSHLEDMQVYCEVEDRDFDHPIVVAGNWNTVTKWNEQTRSFDTIDDTPKRLGDAIEKLAGVDTAWSDMVTTCDDCGKLLNTNPTTYGWKPHYVTNDHGLVCEECLDVPEWLESLEDNPRRAVHNDSIDPEEHGYFQIEEDLENGWYRGQDADPKTIAKALRARGLKRFIFQIDETGQFDMRFSVWLHESEKEAWEKGDELEDSEINGPSVSGAMQAGLQAASAALAALPEGGIKYAKIDGDKVEARTLTPEEFVRGIK